MSSGYPQTLLFVKNADTIEQLVGAMPEAELRPKIDALI
jgi:hypothetical protein